MTGIFGGFGRLLWENRLVIYALLGALIALTIGIFHWHRAVYLAANL